MRCFFSLSSISVAAPTLTTATPPASLASRSWSFSASQSESCPRFPLDLKSAFTSSWHLHRRHRRVVLGDHDAPRPTEQVERRVLELEPDLLGDELGACEDGDVTSMPCAARQSGAFTRRTGTGHGSVHHEGGESLASTSSAMISNGLPDCMTFSRTGTRSWTEETLPFTMSR